MNFFIILTFSWLMFPMFAHIAYVVILVGVLRMLYPGRRSCILSILLTNLVIILFRVQIVHHNCASVIAPSMAHYFL